MAWKGKFKPLHPNKYVGDHTAIVYRSGLELRFMKFLDSNPDVIAWASEEIIVPYVCPTDNKRHRYFPDFVVKRRDKDGKTATLMIEIKPFAQTKEPKKPSKKTRRYITECLTWGKNQAKWEAAREYCADKNWQFVIITEKELGNW